MTFQFLARSLLPSLFTWTPKHKVANNDCFSHFMIFRLKGNLFHIAVLYDNSRATNGYH